MLRVCAAFAVLIGFVATASAANPDPKSLIVPPEELSKAREFVQKLGSETYTDRETAERGLAEMGRAARAVLLDAVNLDADPEVRARASRLLPKANALEMKARLDTFLADTDSKYEHDMPGWNRLRGMVRGEWKIMGWTFRARTDAATNKAARELFIEFFQAPGGRILMTAVDGQASDLANLVSTRKQELYNMRFGRPASGPARQPSVGEVAAVMFADALSGGKGAGRTNVFTSVMSTSGISQAAQGTDGRAVAMRAIVSAWFDSRTDPVEMYSAMSMANGWNLDVAGRLAARLLVAPGAVGYQKAQAAMTLAKCGATECAPALTQALRDESVVSNMRVVVDGVAVQIQIQVRDVAFAAAVMLRGEKPTDHGMKSRTTATGTGFQYTYTNWYFPDADKRKEALAELNEASGSGVKSPPK